MKSLLVLILVSLCIQTYSQDTTNFYVNSFHLQYSSLIRVNRSTTLPDKVRSRAFYQQYFGDYGVPERIITKQYFGNQIGVNLGFRFDSYSTKNNHELLLGIGYQSSGEYIDILERNNVFSQDSLQSNSNLARINIEQEYRELYLNGAWLFKSNGKTLSLHTGIGFNMAFSNPRYWVSEFEKGIQTKHYKVRNGVKIYPSIYVPFGFEVVGDNGRGGGFVFGLDNTIRFDNHFFVGLSISLGYKL